MSCRRLRCWLIVTVVLGTAADIESPARHHAARNQGRKLQAPEVTLSGLAPPPPAPCVSPFPMDYDYEACLGWCSNNPSNKCAMLASNPPSVWVFGDSEAAESWKIYIRDRGGI